MVILHIAHIDNNPLAGVPVAVPQHVISQSNFANIGFYNTANIKINDLEKFQILSDNKFNLSNLSEPFNKPDLVLLHEVYYPEYVAITNELIKQKVPYIIIPHGCLTREAQNKKKLKKFIGNTLFFNKIIKNSLAIQCLSETEKNTTFFNSPKFIGSNGVSLPEIRKQTFNKDAVNITFIGRVDIYHKGLDLLLKAVSEIKEFLSEKNVKLNIFGPCDDVTKSSLLKIINENSIQNLVFLNSSVIGEEKIQTLLNTDIFIHTSRFEGMPLGILEAMSFGVPCLVTRGTTLFDFVTNNNAGWAAETDFKSISKTIIEAVNEQENFEKYSQNAISALEKNFTWDIVSEKNIDLYTNLIKKDFADVNQKKQ